MNINSAEGQHIQIKFFDGHIVDHPGLYCLTDTTNNIEYGRGVDDQGQDVLLRHHVGLDLWFKLNNQKTEFEFTALPVTFDTSREFRKSDLLKEAGWLVRFTKFAAGQTAGAIVGGGATWVINNPHQVVSATGAIAGAMITATAHIVNASSKMVHGRRSA